MNENQIKALQSMVAFQLGLATKDHAAAKASISGSFELGFKVQSSQFESLAETQERFALWTNIDKMVARGIERGNLAERLNDRLEDMQEHLFAQGAGGSTSAFQNGLTEVERKALLHAYRVLSSAAKG